MSYHIKKYNHAMDHMWPGGYYCYEFDIFYLKNDWRALQKRVKQDRKRRSTKARRLLDQAVIEEQLEDMGP